MNFKRFAQNSADRGRSRASSYLLVVGGLVGSLFVLGLLFVVEMQFAGGSQPSAVGVIPRTSPPPAESIAPPPMVDLPAGPAEDVAPAAGRSFQSRAEFAAYQEREGYLLGGRFDEAWPATIIGERTAVDKISFVRENGTKHQYTGVPGYRLKVVRLRTHAGKEAVFVLRSKQRW